MELIFLLDDKRKGFNSVGLLELFWVEYGLIVWRLEGFRVSSSSFGRCFFGKFRDGGRKFLDRFCCSFGM